jgi:cation diffusion facilitator family transporter
MMHPSTENIKIQRLVVLVGLLLFVVKMAAWYLTGSVAILSDALESTVNVVAGFIGLYSLRLSAKPRDEAHPYGHGTVEFLSAGLEGALIAVAGMVIIYEALHNLREPRPIGRIDTGIWLTASAGAANYLIGWLAVRKGRANRSLALVASGRHLQADTYTTIGIIGGLVLVRYTGWQWVDSVLALMLALLIIVTGYKILRSSLAGIMDEADHALIGRVVACLDAHREDNWIDLHNLRIIKYGSVLHLDFHLTVPWYLTVREAHEEIDRIGRLVRAEFGDSLEMFVHTDACLPISCGICAKQDCTQRLHPFQRQVGWTVENVASDERHRV